MIERMTLLLLQKMGVAEVANNDMVRNELSSISQRHPLAFQAATKSFAQELDNSMTQEFEQVLTALTIGATLSPRVNSLISARSHDPDARLRGLRDLLAGIDVLTTKDMDEMGVISEVIEAGLGDANASLVGVIYQTPEILLSIFPEKRLLDIITNSLKGPDVPRAVVRMHLSFLAKTLFEKDPSLSTGIIFQGFLPYLLFSKSRQKLALQAWNIVEESELKNHFIFAGCFSLLGTDAEAQRMESMNAELTSKLAGNIASSSEHPLYSSLFFSRINDQNPHTRLFACLVVRSLVNSSPIDRQIDYAHNIIQHIGLNHLDDLKNVLGEAKTLGEFISYDTFGSSIISKPSHLSTFRRLQASLLALLPGISPPIDVKLEWLSPSSSDNQGSRFVQVMRMLYRLANQSSSLHSLSTNMLRAIFVNLKDVSLLFLAGIWSDDETPTSTKVAALTHAKAFLLAHASSQNLERIDFQVIVPALTVALQFTDRQLRQLAVECIAIISTLSSGKRSAVFALDTIYGEKSEGVQVLDFGEVEKYTKLISRFGDGVAADPEYIRVIHQEHLGTGANNGKKERNYKERLLCFFSSHCVAWDNRATRLPLLSLIEPMHGPAKLQLLLPLIKQLVEQSPSLATLQDQYSEEQKTLYSRLIFASFHPSCAPFLKQNSEGSLDVLKQALRSTVDPSKLPQAAELQLLMTKSRVSLDCYEWIQDAILDQLTGSLYSALDFDLRLDLCSLLLDLVVSQARMNESTPTKRALTQLLRDVPVAISLLDTLSPKAEGDQPKAAKRAKVESSLSSEGDVTKMIPLAEALSSTKENGTPELVSALIESIRRLCSVHDSSKSEYDYIEQLLLNGLDSSITSISSSAFAPNSLRIDVLINLIRVTNNSQTFHQALLVISNIARLAPEEVLQNVMSIFTFMGSNVFHRDDAYSFRVVQKTIDGIVPVMVESLKNRFKDPLDRYIGSRDFLRVFTDASIHIPRHRRTHFYNHFIEVIGPDDYLAPVCMLLVEKAANRALRPKDGDAAQALAVPLAAINHHAHELRLQVLCEVVKECQRLIARVENLDDEARVSFLEVTADEHSSPKGSLKKKILALLTFVGLAIQAFAEEPRYQPTTSEPNNPVQELVSCLVAVSRGEIESAPTELQDINNAARRCLSKVMAIVPASDFVQSIMSMLSIEEPKVQEGALDLLAERLPNMSSQAREKARTTVITIIEKICALLSAEVTQVSTLSTLRALKVVAATGPSSEDAMLSRSTPAVISLASRADVSEAALSTLTVLIPKLGPRMIPHLKPLVEASLTSLQLELESDEYDVSRRDEALRVLISGISSTPTFLGEELLSVISSCITLSADGDPEADDVLETVTENIPGRMLVPMLVKLWENEYSSRKEYHERLVSFFEFSKEALSKALREDVMDHLKPLFKLFLGAFDLRLSFSSGHIQDVETAVADAFLEIVTKLNELSFKPLFRRWFDWAFANGLDQRTCDARQTTFTKVMGHLIETFKNLITPYMITLLDPVAQLLEQFANGSASYPDLWESVLQMLSYSFVFDEGVFWRDDRLEKLLQKLIKQVSVSCSLGPTSAQELDEHGPTINSHKTTLTSCLTHFAHAISREDLLKSFNLALLMESRSEDPKVQLLVLTCVSDIWTKESTRFYRKYYPKHSRGYCDTIDTFAWAAFISETMTFVEDLAESEHDEVAKGARALNRIMESVNGGPIDDKMDF
ncbi:snoRNA-binding rRNA-processing protein utp10 [Tulasnella sp. 419]|nr:snoRNA-binding rRNA-processing protein utp10 [Tulasnella sp. 419]